MAASLLFLNFLVQAAGIFIFNAVNGGDFFFFLIRGEKIRPPRLIARFALLNASMTSLRHMCRGEAKATGLNGSEFSRLNFQKKFSFCRQYRPKLSSSVTADARRSCLRFVLFAFGALEAAKSSFSKDVSGIEQQKYGILQRADHT